MAATITGVTSVPTSSTGRWASIASQIVDQIIHVNGAPNGHAVYVSLDTTEDQAPKDFTSLRGAVAKLLTAKGSGVRSTVESEFSESTGAMSILLWAAPKRAYSPRKSAVTDAAPESVTDAAAPESNDSEQLF